MELNYATEISILQRANVISLNEIYVQLTNNCHVIRMVFDKKQNNLMLVLLSKKFVGH